MSAWQMSARGPTARMGAREEFPADPRKVREEEAERQERRDRTGISEC